MKDFHSASSINGFYCAYCEKEGKRESGIAVCVEQSTQHQLCVYTYMCNMYPHTEMDLLKNGHDIYIKAMHVPTILCVCVYVCACASLK